MVRTEIDPITGLNEPGENEGHPHKPPEGLAPIFAELFKIKSVIRIKYPEMKFSLRSAPDRKIRRVIPQGGGWLGSVHGQQAVGKWFPVNAA
jgi:hypothetical protein